MIKQGGDNTLTHEAKSELRSDRDLQAPLFDDLFLVDVIHKIKNGLGGIEGFAALLERDLEPEDPRRRLAQRVQDGVRKINDVSVAVMLLARPLELNRESVRIGAFIRQVLENLIPLSAESQIDIVIDDAVARREIDADPRNVQRLIQYLLQLIGRMDGRLVSIHLVVDDQGKVVMDYRFTSDKLLAQWPASLDRWAAELHPVEARLALAVALKIVQSHDALFLLHAPEGQPTIRILFN